MSNLIPKHYTGLPCDICGKKLSEANTWPKSSPICDNCRKATSKEKLDKKWSEIREREGVDNEETVAPSEGNVPLVLRRENTSHEWRTIIWVLGGIFVLWFIWTLISSRGDSSKVYIDCRQSSWQNSPYCDGTFESEARDQDGIENNYYQNIVR